jgi:hypothetical protein
MSHLKLILLILLLINYSFERRRPRTKEKKKVNPMDKLPKHITKELLCVGCFGLTKELLVNLRGKKREFEVFDGLKEVCESNFIGYGTIQFNLGYTREQVSESCFAFMDIFDNSRIEYIFINRADDRECYRRLCIDKTKVINK